MKHTIDGVRSYLEITKGLKTITPTKRDDLYRTGKALVQEAARKRAQAPAEARFHLNAAIDLWATLASSQCPVEARKLGRLIAVGWGDL